MQTINYPEVLFFDLGSSGVKAKGFLFDKNNDLKQNLFYEKTDILHIKDVLENDGYFSSDVIAKSSQAVHDSTAKFIAMTDSQLHNSDEGIAVCGLATEAFRVALNANEIIDSYNKEVSSLLNERNNIDIDIKAIPQDDEAKFGYLSLVDSILSDDLTRDEILVWDVGAGSMQMTFSQTDNNNGHITLIANNKIGTQHKAYDVFSDLSNGSYHYSMGDELSVEDYDNLFANHEIYSLMHGDYREANELGNIYNNKHVVGAGLHYYLTQVVHFIESEGNDDTDYLNKPSSYTRLELKDTFFKILNYAQNDEAVLAIFNEDNSNLFNENTLSKLGFMYGEMLEYDIDEVFVPPIAYQAPLYQSIANNGCEVLSDIFNGMDISHAIIE
ncbi:MAG: hypothetical protein OEY79_02135 [Anaplasmataceae bacterium]|nr:hypothetical protein [Anaplasmataceae bacterium]